MVLRTPPRTPSEAVTTAWEPSSKFMIIVAQSSTSSHALTIHFLGSFRKDSIRVCRPTSAVTDLRPIPFPPFSFPS